MVWLIGECWESEFHIIKIDALRLKKPGFLPNRRLKRSISQKNPVSGLHFQEYMTFIRMKGNYRKATKEYINLLLETVEVEPEKYGYEFGRWTTARLAIYLGEKTGIYLSSTQVRRILKSKKYVDLWAKYSLEDQQDAESNHRVFAQV